MEIIDDNIYVTKDKGFTDTLKIKIHTMSVYFLNKKHPVYISLQKKCRKLKWMLLKKQHFLLPKYNILFI